MKADWLSQNKGERKWLLVEADVRGVRTPDKPLRTFAWEATLIPARGKSQHFFLFPLFSIGLASQNVHILLQQLSSSLSLSRILILFSSLSDLFFSLSRSSRACK